MTHTPWWHAYPQIGLPLKQLITAEDTADTIRIYSTDAIHGLLQTEAYAQTPLAGHDSSPEDITWGWDVRARRQAVLRRPTPPRLHVILDEAVLLRPGGGTAGFREQLSYLIDVAHWPAVTIQVVPLAAGVVGGGNPSFQLFDPPLAAYTETVTTGYYITDPAEVAKYEAQFGRHQAAALSPDASRELIYRHLRDLAAGGVSGPPQ